MDTRSLTTLGRLEYHFKSFIDELLTEKNKLEADQKNPIGYRTVMWNDFLLRKIKTTFPHAYSIVLESNVALDKNNQAGDANRAVVMAMALVVGYITKRVRRRACELYQIQIDVPWQNISSVWTELINMNCTDRPYDPQVAYNRFARDKRVTRKVTENTLSLFFSVEHAADYPVLESLMLAFNNRVALYPDIAGEFAIISKELTMGVVAYQEKLVRTERGLEHPSRPGLVTALSSKKKTPVVVPEASDLTETRAKTASPAPRECLEAVPIPVPARSSKRARVAESIQPAAEATPVPVPLPLDCSSCRHEARSPDSGLYLGWLEDVQTEAHPKPGGQSDAGYCELNIIHPSPPDDTEPALRYAQDMQCRDASQGDSLMLEFEEDVSTPLNDAENRRFDALMLEGCVHEDSRDSFWQKD